MPLRAISSRRGRLDDRERNQLCLGTLALLRFQQPVFPLRELRLHQIMLLTIRPLRQAAMCACQKSRRAISAAMIYLRFQLQSSDQGRDRPQREGAISRPRAFMRTAAGQPCGRTLTVCEPLQLWWELLHRDEIAHQ